MTDLDKYKRGLERDIERALTNRESHRGMKTKLATQRKARTIIKMIYQYQTAMLNPTMNDKDSQAYLRAEHLKLQGQLDALNWVLGPGRIEP